MNINPLFSVIIPIYNAEKYLAYCIDSILSQEFNSLEIILINDGSSDNSEQICKYYASKDSRIHVFSKKNEGVSSARNLGLSKAKGEWICFIDADDLLKENFFSDAYNTIKLKNIDLYTFGCNTLKNNIEKKLFSYKEGYYNINTFWHEQYHHLASWGYLLSKNIIKNSQLKFSTQLIMSEDRVFMAEYFLHCNIIYSTSKNYYLYRLTDESACGSKMTYKKAKSQLQAAYALLKLNNNYSKNTHCNIIIPNLIYNCLQNYITSIAELNNKLYDKDVQQNISKIISILKSEKISIRNKFLFCICRKNYSYYTFWYQLKKRLKIYFR